MSNLVRSSQDWQVTKCSIKERFKELLSLSQWTDCTFSVGDDEDVELIRCHKLVLAVSSPVFEALFFGGLADPTEQVIKVPDMEPHIFKLFLKYIYSDTLELKSVGEAGGLLYASKKYLMPQLSQVCLDYLVDNTFVQTLWDVLHVAEVLAEEELINACLAVMCRYPYDIWWLKGEHMSGRTLRQLLDQRHVNMSECQLWKMAVGWAEEECRQRGLAGNAADMRAVLDECGVLGRFRFLAMNPTEFENVVVPDQVLTSEECSAVISGGPLPSTWVTAQEPRFPLCPATHVTWISKRWVLAYNRTWMFGGPHTTIVSSDSRVLVTGFEVFTRLVELPAYSSSINFALSQNFKYRERLVVFVKDCEGNILNKTDHDQMVDFNSLQRVQLERPLWFSASAKYEIIFELPTGQYSLGTLSEVATCKGTTFSFKDSPNSQQHNGVSFINGVLFSL